MPANGLIVMPPTSIAYSGTSAAINTDKSVSFSAVTSLSLNGVFTATYDNYMIVVRFVASTGINPNLRLRVGGVDNSTASSYVWEQLQAGGGVVTANRTTTTSIPIGLIGTAQRAGGTTYVFGPAIAQPTAFRTVGASNIDNAEFYDYSGTHNQSTSYDGFSIIPSSGNMTGLLTVFGFNN